MLADTKKFRVNKMNVFKTFHPVINFIYFTSIVIFSVVCTHPLYILISFVFSTLYLLMLNVKFIKYATATVLLIIILYPAVNHGGATILTYLPDGNPLTAESIIYGFALAFSTVSAFLWFLCSARVLTSDKLMCVFGIFHTTASLMLSMTLRFIPRFTNRMKTVLNAQKGIGRNIEEANIFKKIRLLMSAFSITVTWATENTIDISDSMKARGYGITKRTSFSTFRYKRADSLITAIIILLVLCIITATSKIHYFPYPDLNPLNPVGVTAYFIFCGFPLLTEITEKVKNRDA